MNSISRAAHYHEVMATIEREKTMSEKTNAARIQRETSRTNELLDLLREDSCTYGEAINTLATRWNVSHDTVKHVIQYAKKKKLIVSKNIMVVRNAR